MPGAQLRTLILKPQTLSLSLTRAQEVEYVKQEAKLVYLLECLQKTAPPVLVFAEKTADVDDIHEYLLVKGVEAVAVHGGKDQEEREQAIDAFKARPRARAPAGRSCGSVAGARQGCVEQGGRVWRVRGERVLSAG